MLRGIKRLVTWYRRQKTVDVCWYVGDGWTWGTKLSQRVAAYCWRHVTWYKRHVTVYARHVTWHDMWIWTWGTKLSQREAACPRKFLLHLGFKSGRREELFSKHYENNDIWYGCKIKVIISSSYHHHIIIISSSCHHHKQDTDLKVAFFPTKLLPGNHLEPLVSVPTSLLIKNFVMFRIFFLNFFVNQIFFKHVFELKLLFWSDFFLIQMVWCRCFFLPYLPHCQCSEALQPWPEHLGSCILTICWKTFFVWLSVFRSSSTLTGTFGFLHWHLAQKHFLCDPWIHGLKSYKHTKNPALTFA